MTAAPTVCSQRHVPLDKKLDAYYPEVNWQQTRANHLSFSDEALKCFAVIKLSQKSFFLLLHKLRIFVFLQSENLQSFLSGLFNLFLLSSICHPWQSCLVVNVKSIFIFVLTTPQYFFLAIFHLFYPFFFL